MGKKLTIFTDRCRFWHSKHELHNYPARQDVYLALAQRHGTGAVIRHQHQIKDVLNRAELQATGS